MSSSPLDPILVPWEGPAWGRVAAAVARALAHGTGASTTLLRVGDAPEPALGEEAERFVGSVRVLDGTGDPEDAIAAAAEEAGITVLHACEQDLVSGILRPSLAREVLGRTTRPVLVVHEWRPMQRILCAVDGGPASLGIAQAAEGLRRATDARLTLATVLPEMEGLRSREPEGEALADVRPSIRARAEAAFAVARPALGRRWRERVLFGESAAALRNAATSADIVVVGRRGRSGVDVVDPDSVAFALAARGPFATLVV